MSLILSIDLGKFSSVACVYEHPVGTHRFVTLDTTPQAVHDLIAEHSPDRVVIEVANTAGWVRDLCEVAGVEVQVANPTIAARDHIEPLVMSMEDSRKLVVELLVCLWTNEDEAAGRILADSFKVEAGRYRWPAE